jgi:hypothetical protein
MWWVFLIVSLASIPLSVEMARERERSSKVWFWVAFAFGPLALLVLALLGQSKRSVPAN